jgi:hypothetical protein
MLHGSPIASTPSQLEMHQQKKISEAEPMPGNPVLKK